MSGLSISGRPGTDDFGGDNCFEMHCFWIGVAQVPEDIAAAANEFEIAPLSVMQHLLLPNKIGLEQRRFDGRFRPLAAQPPRHARPRGVHVAPCRPWMHGSSPCMTHPADYRGRIILHIVSENALYSITSDARLYGGEDREKSRRRFPGYRPDRRLRSA